MIFAGIDVNIITHEKAMRAGVEAFGLWSWGMCYAQLHETDGHLPEVAVMNALGETRRALRRAAVRLCTAGLWIESNDGSFRVHNYATKNQTSDEIATRREERKARNAHNQRVSRERRHHMSPVTVTALSPPVTGSPPEPTPEPTPEPDQIRLAAPAAAPTKGRGTRLPSDWTPSAEAQVWAKAQGVADPLGTVLDEFRDYWCPLTGARATKLDWDATFRNRVRHVAQRSRPSGFAPRGAEITKQPYDPDAPWLKLPEVG